MKQLLTTVFVLISVLVLAQPKIKEDTSVRDSAVATPMVRVSYAAQIPVGDFADRFGFTNNIGGSVAYKTKSNWIFSLGGHYMFGNNVVGKDSLLGNLLNSSNIIIGANGEQAFVDISQQGYMIDFQVGKIFPWAAPNPNSGFIFTLGGGFMEHWIRYNAEGDNVPQIRDDYHKGYDRLTNGIFIQEFIGYHFQGNTKMLNFYGGFEFTQGFTGNRRSYDIPTMSVKDDKYNDFLFGFKIGWMMPFYKRNQDKYYYY
ncbi:MAG: hypothetical protein ACPGU4_10850 [Flavobacteriales bacterium]